MSDFIDEGKAEPAFRYKYKGVFDYDKLTTFLIKWLKNRGYDINEKKHKHKMSCPHGFEIERVIEGWRKIDDFFQYEVKVSMHLWDAHEVDVTRNGKNVKMWDARIEITIDILVVCDYQNRWSSRPFYSKLLKFYIGYVIKKEIIVKHMDPLYYRVLGLGGDIKKILEMETATVF
ncbi:hypothetical protein HQ545_08405 [Candidatus Woesearchaeota archaeon]|nr:hypothetical protein [Candidatus Woesearchaeota archaeon]